MDTIKQNKTFVYYAKIPVDSPFPSPVCEARKAEIDGCKNEKIKREKAFVWALLERAVEKTYSIPPQDVEYAKTEQGKWICDKFHFSLSHSKDVVAVALSFAPVGVDVQIVSTPRESVIKKLFSVAEIDTYSTLPANEKELYFTEIWTRKESAFKVESGGGFFTTTPQANIKYKTKEITNNDNTYLLTVATQTENVAFIESEL